MMSCLLPFIASHHILCYLHFKFFIIIAAAAILFVHHLAVCNVVIDPSYLNSLESSSLTAFILCYTILLHYIAFNNYNSLHYMFLEVS